MLHIGDHEHNSCMPDSVPFATLNASCRSHGLQALATMPASGPLDERGLQQLLADGVGDMRYLHDQQQLRRDPDQLLPGYRSILVCALAYQPQREAQELKRARYAAGRDYHKLLRRKLARVGQTLLNPDGQPSSSRACVDSAPLNERTLAQRAGLGWLGRNALLIHPKRGSYQFLGFLLTTAVLEEHSGPGADDRCGSCSACEDRCPTAALTGRRVLSERCISYLTIEHQGVIPRDLARNFDGWWYGCDICQEVCPWNRFAPQAEDQRLCGSDDEARLLQLSADDWQGYTQGRALKRISYDQFRRNLAVALWSLGRLQDKSDFDDQGIDLVSAQLRELGVSGADHA